ncbi:DUF58 domain-containing protein [Acetatifactor muris]|uniref:Uncharacterized protein n=1 Tax=Acetatifactor muris TaxID=879566 RepID=A0A2K4ZM47_9FIRM|nr:DUF58 domain-containing protein [Acetatifactor muris]MCR2049772.1 DUF58 domain-containing protein [Acetatifactor muris]SOY31553.1 hypothetical protein AMURIS_04297 [Acetatifactor muris]
MTRIIGIGIIGFLLLILQKYFYEKFWQRHLNVRIHFGADHIFEGEQGELKEVIENRKRLPLSMLKVKFKTDRHLLFGNEKGSRTTDQYYRNDVFRIGGGERVTRTLKFKGGRRGYYTIDEISLVASDLFLLNQMVAEQPVRTELYVYPRPFDSSRLRQSLIQLNGEVLSRRHLLEDPFEYRGIREYQPYDDMRSINWKATAKTGDFKVNQRNYTSLKSVRIFFNIQDDHILKRESSVELSLRVVASLCQLFLRQGIQVSCHGNGVDIVTHSPLSVKAKAGEGQMDTIYRALARIDVGHPTVNFTEYFEEILFQKAQGTFTYFVAPNQYDDFVELLTRYQDKGNPFVWFYPVADESKPEVPAALESCVEVLYEH